MHHFWQVNIVNINIISVFFAIYCLHGHLLEILWEEYEAFYNFVFESSIIISTIKTFENVSVKCSYNFGFEYKFWVLFWFLIYVACIVHHMYWIFVIENWLYKSVRNFQHGNRGKEDFLENDREGQSVLKKSSVDFFHRRNIERGTLSSERTSWGNSQFLGPTDVLTKKWLQELD